jgi:hypothetical protein
METLQEHSENIYFAVRDAFINQSVVFLGAYASSLYSKYMPDKQRRILKRVPDFDVLSEDPDQCALVICERLKSAGFKKVKQVSHSPIGEVVPRHIEIKVDKETIAFIYEPIACHNYNIIHIDGREVRVATIDTMLNFYLAFYYANQPYYHRERILCMAKYLFEVERKSRLAQNGLLKRFSINCYGKQETLETMRAEKAAKYEELKNDRTGKEFNEWFFKYVPGDVEKPKKKGEN